VSAKRKEAEQLPEMAMEGAGPADDRPPEEVAGYIADMVLQLRNMAKQKDLDFLAYLLEMSFQEAFDLASGDKKG
jgi:hypothetical protein